MPNGIRKATGCILIALPFVVLTVLGMEDVGPLAMLAIYGTAAVVVAAILLGVHLIME